VQQLADPSDFATHISDLENVAAVAAVSDAAPTAPAGA